MRDSEKKPRREGKEVELENNKRIDETMRAHRVTKRGPMVHGIQFYTSCAHARGLKDKKRLKKEKSIKKLRYFRDTYL